MPFTSKLFIFNTNGQSRALNDKLAANKREKANKNIVEKNWNRNWKTKKITPSTFLSINLFSFRFFSFSNITTTKATNYAATKQSIIEPEKQKHEKKKRNAKPKEVKENLKQKAKEIETNVCINLQAN